MAGHLDNDNDYFIVVKVSLSVQIQKFFERQNNVKQILRRGWPPIRYYVFVDFHIWFVCYQVCFQIDVITDLLKIQSTNLKKFPESVAAQAQKRSNQRKGFLYFIRYC